MYTITQFAKIINVTPKTLRVWDKEDKLKPIKLSSGHRRYTEEHLRIIKNIKYNNPEKINIIYCRESISQQKNSLNNQIEKCKEFCLNKGLSVDKIISDIGSGLNYNRKGLKELLHIISNEQIDNLIIYYKDRLMRFGYELLEELSKIHNFNIIIIDNSETNKTKEQEFAEDLISIIHHFSMKLYGSRNYKTKVKAAENNILEIKNEISKS